jgi:hypothetical protein
MDNQKIKQILSGEWHQWEGRGCKERVIAIIIIITYIGGKILCSHV